MLTTLAFLLFSGTVKDLEHPDYQRREAAQATLYNAWPLSTPVVRHALATTRSPEVRARTARLDASIRYREKRFFHGTMFLYHPEWWLSAVDHDIINWDIVDYALTLPEGSLALKLLYYPSEKTNLPWAPAGVHHNEKLTKNLQLRETLCKIADKMNPGVMMMMDPKRVTYPNLGGLDNMRFWIRRLPDPQSKNVNLAEMEKNALRQQPGVIPFPPLE